MRLVFREHDNVLFPACGAFARMHCNQVRPRPYRLNVPGVRLGVALVDLGFQVGLQNNILTPFQPLRKMYSPFVSAAQVFLKHSPGCFG